MWLIDELNKNKTLIFDDAVSNEDTKNYILYNTSTAWFNICSLVGLNFIESLRVYKRYSQSIYQDTRNRIKILDVSNPLLHNLFEIYYYRNKFCLEHPQNTIELHKRNREIYYIECKFYQIMDEHKKIKNTLNSIMSDGGKETQEIIELEKNKKILNIFRKNLKILLDDLNLDNNEFELLCLKHEISVKIYNAVLSEISNIRYEEDRLLLNVNAMYNDVLSSISDIARGGNLTRKRKEKGYVKKRIYTSKRFVSSQNKTNNPKRGGGEKKKHQPHNPRIIITERIFGKMVYTLPITLYYKKIKFILKRRYNVQIENYRRS